MISRLFDTNVVARLIGKDEKAFYYYNSTDDICLSITTVGELYFGIYNSSKIDFNKKIYSTFIDGCRIISQDNFIAEEYGKLKTSLIKNGFNIPDNDIWIAAAAICSNMELITFDKHFSYIDYDKIIILS